MDGKASSKVARKGEKATMVEVEGHVGREDAEENVVEVLEHHEDGAVAATGDAAKGSGVTSDVLANTPEGAREHVMWQCGESQQH